MNREKIYPIDDQLEIVTENGNRAPGDRKIWFRYKNMICPNCGKQLSFRRLIKIHELYQWIWLKARVEDNNYPISEGKRGRFFLRDCLNWAINGVLWEKAKAAFKFPER